jgi:hypothetical protein
MIRKQIEIGAFMGPRRPGHQYWNGEYGKHPDDPKEGYRSFITEKDFQDYIDCGFTFAYLEEDGWYDYDYINRKQVDKFEDSSLYTYMELAEKMNLPVVCSSKWLIELVISGKEELSDEDKAIIKKMVEDLSKYKLIIHCGSCMLNRQETLSRLEFARNSGIPVTNYGMAISFCQGVLERAMGPFISK